MNVVVGEACGPINSFPPVSLIEGFLYIGSQKDASNKHFLDTVGISGVLNMGHTCGRPLWVKDTQEKQQYEYMEIHALDAPGYPLLNHLKEAVPFLEAHRKAGKKVLISCHQGINRSATIAAAYLSALTNTPMPEIIEGMRAKRPVLQNDSFVASLLSWDREPLRKTLRSLKA